MAVIITGMDMPESCEKCQMSYDMQLSGCPILHKWSTTHEENRMDDCPLKSVDELIDKIEIEICSRNYYTRETDTRDKIIDIIKEYCEVNE